MLLLILLSTSSHTLGLILSPGVEERELPFKLHLVGGQPERGSPEEDSLVREYVRYVCQYGSMSECLYVIMSVSQYVSMSVFQYVSM